MELTSESIPTLDDLSIAESLTSCDRKTKERAERASQARRSSQRRQFVDPTTCDRQYTPAEWEFMEAIQAYKQASGRMYPTWSEVLEVLKGLGYQKVS